MKQLFGSAEVVEWGEIEGSDTRAPNDELAGGGEKL
jgi:hypothetical protein